MTFLIVPILFIFPVIAITGYHHYKISQQPDYNPNTTLLNYGIIGSGEKKLVLLHGLTGSLNYWKRSLESISKSFKEGVELLNAVKSVSLEINLPLPK